MSALEIIDQVPEFARLVALELRKNLSPHEDEISTNEAYRRYGRSWVEKWAGLGQLHPQTHGSKRMYSIAELERVKAKENEAARLVLKRRTWVATQEGSSPSHVQVVQWCWERKRTEEWRASSRKIGMLMHLGRSSLGKRTTGVGVDKVAA